MKRIARLQDRIRSMPSSGKPCRRAQHDALKDWIDISCQPTATKRVEPLNVAARHPAAVVGAAANEPVSD